MLSFFRLIYHYDSDKLVTSHIHRKCFRTWTTHWLPKTLFIMLYQYWYPHSFQMIIPSENLWWITIFLFIYEFVCISDSTWVWLYKFKGELEITRIVLLNKKYRISLMLKNLTLYPYDLFILISFNSKLKILKFFKFKKSH